MNFWRALVSDNLALSPTAAPLNPRRIHEFITKSNSEHHVVRLWLGRAGNLSNVDTQNSGVPKRKALLAVIRKTSEFLEISIPDFSMEAVVMWKILRDLLYFQEIIFEIEESAAIMRI
ncbi:hypothetical protein NECAME_16562 [Necator americanus]|uniref:Uncharacterized protein n=1 Tax=Necator americanus TaxID=51031 RepID=W2TVU2_NECAM|nr:hypothetical protein NECAME_16562 [Necator americanus]ETN85943.1 hypothetical protein NECAME_16562 [Necator americanus]